jgi:DNA-directed RNA polymerase subunit RPC12/RpoP
MHRAGFQEQLGTMIDFECPHCSRRLKVPEAYLGAMGNCAHCGGQITVWVAPPTLKEQYAAASEPPLRPLSDQPVDPVDVTTPALANGFDVDNITITRDIEALHFTLHRMIEHYRGKQATDAWAFSAAVQACHHQISIAPFVKKHLESTYKRPLPPHIGFETLARVLENERLWDKAAKLYKNAKFQGWAGDWDAQIRRCENQVASPIDH